MAILPMPELKSLGNMAEGQAVHIVWLDSATLVGWTFSEDLPTAPKVIESIGFVALINEKVVVLTSSRSNTGGFVSPLIIPICSVEEYRILEL